MKRDSLKFLCGAAAAATYGHIAYAVWTARGTVSVPVYKGRQWGVGKMLTEAGIYGAASLVLGYFAWRPQIRQLLQTSPQHSR